MADVLVIDDTRIERVFLCSLLERLGVSSDEASSGQQGIDMAGSGSYRLIFVDDVMPGLDGESTLKKIKSIKPDTPIVITGENNSSDSMFVLKKPVEYRRLTEILQKYLTFSPEHYSHSPLEGLLDISLGERFCGSNEGFREALAVFYDTLKARSCEIEKYYNDGEWKLYTIKVHALKSSSRIIGASSLSSFAEELEEAGKEQNIDRITRDTPKLLEDYRKLYEPIGEYLGINNTAGDDSDDRPEVPAGKLADAYESMPEFIEQMDVDLMEMVLDSIEEYRLPEEDAKVIGRIRECLTELDWDSMTDILKKRRADS